NRGACSQVDYSEAELLTMTPLAIMPAFTLDQFNEILQPLRSGAKASTIFETIHRSRTGHDIPVEIHLQQVRTNNAAPNFVAVVRDITERKRANLKLQEHAEHLQAIVENAIDGIITIDEQGMIDSFNPAAERLFGHTADSVLGRNVKCLMPDPYQSEHDGYLRHYHETGHAQIIGIGREVTGLRKDGSTFPMDLAVSEIYLGNMRHYMGIVRDISERKDTEQQLEQAALNLEFRNMELAAVSETAVSATKAKSQFLASMSHEIRTPMNAIIAMADLLQETPLSNEQQEYVGRFSRAATNLLDLVNDILDLSKIEAGHLELEAIAFDTHDLIDHIGELMAARAHTKHLDLVAFVHPDVPTWVIGDQTRLRQVLTNLVGNAIKFAEQGEIVLYVEPYEDDPGAIRYSVSDSGIGIPADKMETIFESFTQVDASTTRRFGGTGLGLSISKQLVEMMGGRLTADSIEGIGSTFSFALRLPEAPGSPSHPPSPISDLRGRRILIVDDNETNRMVVREYLMRYEPVLVEAADGPEALAALDAAQQDARPFDLAILDYQMPGMNGLDLAQNIRARKDGASLPLVLHPSDLRGQALSRARELGINSYAYKPVSRKRLLESIATALGVTSAAQGKPEPPPPLHATTLRPLRILVVDDVEDNRDVVKLFLKHTSYVVEEAANGLVAVEKVQAGTYDLVLMDVQMPVMDGLMATATIREWEQANHRSQTPIISLTANAFREDLEKTLAAGCTAHVTKPIKKQALLAAIAQYAKPLSDLAA
ncbi:MAG: PAS domain S-box protein, partial [Nitrospira sp.]|nr:PAS domain S-box protein [Nitrospira sp.]